MRKAPKVRRDRSGRWVSRETIAKREIRRFKFYLAMLGIAIVVGTISQFTNPSKSVQATTEVATTTPIEVYEIADVPTLSAFEVAMHFIESDTELLRAFSENDLTKIKSILDDRAAYARAVGIKEFDKTNR